MNDLTDQSHPLLDRIMIFLMPFFAGTDATPSETAEAILQTLRDYNPTNRIQLLQAAQAIALSLSALDSLSEAMASDLTPAMRLRLRAGANALNRSAQQVTSTLQTQQKTQQPSPSADKPAASKPDAWAIPQRENPPKNPNPPYPAQTARVPAHR